MGTPSPHDSHDLALQRRHLFVAALVLLLALLLLCALLRTPVGAQGSSLDPGSIPATSPGVPGFTIVATSATQTVLYVEGQSPPTVTRGRLVSISCWHDVLADDIVVERCDVRSTMLIDGPCPVVAFGPTLVPLRGCAYLPLVGRHR